MSQKKNNLTEFAMQTDDAQALLANLLENGIITVSDIRDAETMNKKQAVLNLHPYTISRGKGNDTRWQTYVEDVSKPGKRRKVAKKTEAELIDYLHEFYFGKVTPDMQTLEDIYPEWFEYKKMKVARLNTLHRIDTDFKRFYENEPLSVDLLQTPICQIKKLTVEKWAYSMIHKHNLTYKAYQNMITPLRQMLDYMIDKEVLTVNPVRNVKIDKGHFKPSRKKPAKTQIFFTDEIEPMMKAAYELAEETQNELFLAIPLFFLTGIRMGECLGLSFDDFYKEEHIIRIHRSLIVVDTVDENRNWQTRHYQIDEYLKKNADEREVIVTDECFEIAAKVRQMQRKNGRESEYLFTVKTPSSLESKLKRVCRAAGIDAKSPHKIRKTYISTLVNQMMDLDFIRTQVGHKEIQTTLNSYTYSTSRAEQKYADLTSIFGKSKARTAENI